METLKNEPWNFCETPEEKCTMNYCDENGCQNRKRNLVKPKKSKAATFILGQIDKAIEKSNLEQQIEKLEADKAELLDFMKELKDRFEHYNDKVSMFQIESLIQKHKQ